MKQLFVILALLLGCYSQAQVLSKEDIQRLDKLKISTAQLNLQEYKVQTDLNKILKLDRKRRTNKILAIVFTSSAAICVGAGAKLIYDGNRNDEGYGFISEFLGGVLMAGGTVFYGGISVPFWVATNKRKQERDRLIKGLEY